MNETTSQRTFGSSGRQVAAVGQGSWRAEESDAATVIASLQRGLDLGMTHIDTAEMYGSGAAEALVGAAIKGRRDEVFLVSKVLPTHASKRGTIAACEQSLARLKTDRLDCYLLHWRGSHPLAETISAFDALAAEGKILSWGVSNFDVADLEEAQAALERHPIACNQVLYHLTERTVEDHELPYCREHRIAVVAYTPFGRGDWEDRPGAHVIERIAQRHGATPRQVILAFLTREPDAFAIPKASTIAHVEENAGAGDLRLDPDEIIAIGDAFPTRKRRGGLPTL